MSSELDPEDTASQLAVLAERLKTVEVRAPFQQLLNPRFSVISTPTGARLSILIDTYNASTGLPWKDFESSYSFTPYQIGRFVRKPDDFLEFVRRNFVLFLEHETDESLWVEGRHLRPPTHWGPKMS